MLNCFSDQIKLVFELFLVVTSHYENLLDFRFRRPCHLSQDLAADRDLTGVHD